MWNEVRFCFRWASLQMQAQLLLIRPEIKYLAFPFSVALVTRLRVSHMQTRALSLSHTSSTKF